MKATIFTLDAMVDLYSTGKVTIKNEDIISPMNPVWEVFVNKVRGRMALDGEGNLCFEPYQVGAKQATVMAKEIVGQTTVTRTPKLLKISLSLPIEMSQSMMQMTVLEQASLLTDAMHNGLYDRMVGGQESATNTVTQEIDKAA